MSWPSHGCLPTKMFFFGFLEVFFVGGGFQAFDKNQPNMHFLRTGRVGEKPIGHSHDHWLKKKILLVHGQICSHEALRRILAPKESTLLENKDGYPKSSYFKARSYFFLTTMFRTISWVYFFSSFGIVTIVLTADDSCLFHWISLIFAINWSQFFLGWPSDFFSAS